jgi:peptidyl-prolyl cis-trans isomerase B (cyclophilin B)
MEPAAGRRRLLALLGTLALALGMTCAQAQSALPRVKLETSAGEIVLELRPDKAPKTVENFLAYVRKGQYNGTVFHRVIPGFMIQGGGLDARLSERATGQPIQNEADNGLRNDRYTLAMARTSDPHSATAQFFINVADNAFLNHSAPTLQGWGYAVFGKVVAGQAVVDRISAVPTGNFGRNQNVPLSPITINAATVLPTTP